VIEERSKNNKPSKIVLASHHAKLEDRVEVAYDKEILKIPF